MQDENPGNRVDIPSSVGAVRDFPFVGGVDEWDSCGHALRPADFGTNIHIHGGSQARRSQDLGKNSSAGCGSRSSAFPAGTPLRAPWGARESARTAEAVRSSGRRVQS